MKRILFLTALTMFVTQSSPAHGSTVDAGISVGFFYSALGSHGEWIEIDGGLYAWRPWRVRSGWRPYFHGRWAWTDYGWYWVSSESFGWAVYHYGRWYYDDFYGWIWIPDHVWAPAWVEWRYNDDYIGWAPLPPYAHFSVSIGIRFTTHWFAPVHYWSFVHCRYFGAQAITRHVVDGVNTRRLIRTTRSAGAYEVERDRIINRGVDRGFVERRGRTRIERMEIAETRDLPTERIVRDGSRERIEVYRPSRNDMDRQRTIPSEIRRGDRRTSLDVSRIERPDREVNREEVRTGREVNRDGRNETRPRESTSPRDRREQFIPEQRPDSRVDQRRDYRLPRTESRSDQRREQQDVRRSPVYERPQLPAPRMERQSPSIRQGDKGRKQEHQPRREGRTRGETNCG